MARLIDSSVWVGLMRPQSPAELKRMVMELVSREDTAVAEPVVFELLAYANEAEARFLKRYFADCTLLETPEDLWGKAAELGQVCRKRAVTASALDLLIASIAIHHDAELATFDGGYQKIADVCSLRVLALVRPDRR